MNNPELALLGQVVLGIILQWFVRGPKNVPTWLAWFVTAAAAVGVYFWVTPGVEDAFRVDWRTALAGLVSFLLAVRGSGATAKDAKAAPASNSI